MLRRSYNKKTFLLFGLLSFSVLAVVLTAYFVSRETFDDRGVAVSGVGMELRPSSGVITEEGLDIDLVINTHGEEVGGMELTLEYSSSLEYVSTRAGDVPNCTVIRDIEQSGNRVNLSCFIPPESSTYRGSGDTFATVRFRRIGDGQARIEAKDVVFGVRDSRQEVEFDGGSGEYNQGDDLAMILRPSSGTISGTGLSIDLIVDTQNESVGGIEAVLDYSGPIEYVSLRQGEINNCRVDDVHSTQSLSLHCFIDATEPTYRGQGDVFATVNFRATGDGTGEIDITKVEFSLRDDRLEEIFPGGKGEYRAVLTSRTEPTPTPPPTEPTPTPPPTEPTPTPPPRSPFCGTLHDRTFSYDMRTWPSGSFCSTGDANPMNPAFPEPGGSTNWRCISGTQSINCSASRESLPDDDDDDDNGQPPDERDTSPSPRCGDLHNTTFSYDSYTWPSGSFCSVGNSDPTSPSFPAMGASTSWECVSGTQSTSCSVSRHESPTKDKDEGLPETSILDNKGFLSGFALLLVSAIIFSYNGNSSKKNFSMRGKLSL